MKVVVVGPTHVGKTALVRAYFGQSFQDEVRAIATTTSKQSPSRLDVLTTTTHATKRQYYPTIEDSYNDIRMVNGNAIKVTFVDTGGHAKFKTFHEESIKTADCVLLVFDVSSPESLSALFTLRDEVNHLHEDRRAYRIYLIGTKNDIADRRIGRIRETAKKFGHEVRRLLSLSRARARPCRSEIIVPSRQYFEVNAFDRSSVKQSIDSILSDVHSSVMIKKRKNHHETTSSSMAILGADSVHPHAEMSDQNDGACLVS